MNVTHEKLIDSASHVDSQIHRDLYLLLGRDHASLWFKAGDGSFWVVNIFPIEINWQVSIVDQLKRLVLVLTLVSRHKLADSSINAAKLDCVAIEVDSWGLDLAQKLEVKRRRVSD